MDMDHQDEERELRNLREVLKRGMGPARTELRRDLWPKTLRRIEERRQHVPWFDWVLAAAATACMLLFPHVIPVLLYHL
jgi:hypothetical protein